MPSSHSFLHRVPFAWVLVVIFISCDASAQNQSKKDDCLARIAAIPVRNDFAIVAAKIYRGVDTANAYRQLDTLLARPYGDMFWMYGCAGLYYATADVLRPSYKKRIRWCWKHFTPYRGDTENHFLMYYGSLLLMSQAWPDLPDTEWFMGKSSKEIYAESKEYLDHWIDETVRYGQEEWDSPRYGYYYITPLAILAEYTKDPRMKHRFEMMLEYELASYAADYLSGSYCGAHSRVSDECAIDPRKAEINSYGEYFFEDSVKHLLPDVVFAAMTNFHCPKIIRQIATDRSDAYEQYSIKRGRAMLRDLDKWSTTDSSHDSGFHAPVYKYDYMRKDYCLGSIQGGIVQPIQQQSWSLVFNSDKPHNIITGLNPYVSPDELGMFFPEYPSFMLERIGSTKASYTSEDKWEGGSPYEHIYQDKNVLVALYDLPDSVKYRHVDLFIPQKLTDPKLLPKFQAGVRESPPQWIAVFLGPTKIYFYIDGWFIDSSNRVRIMHDNNGGGKIGYVVLCNPTESIVKEIRRQWWDVKDGFLRSGDGKIKVPLRLGHHNPNWLFKSPYLESKKGNGILTMRYKGEERVLDFRN